ncbi:MAG: 2-oxoacid:acceptor oxidoreductase family protein [Anaerolineales bacterium]|nr:2-oxoacid:acceptor oxidoreductase family protein [Anaerolineales bacterium]
MTNKMRALCLAPAGQVELLQGNIAFAVGCVRGGIHAADGYPGTPSSEVIHRGLAHVQDMITVGWSVNEAVAAAVGHGHTFAGRDCVVTMKIPGLFQAGDIFTSGAMFVQKRGALVYYIASDFTPSSTQHVIDPRYLFKSCFVPVLEPRNHQEMHETAVIAADIARTYQTQIVVLAGGALCHSEGLVRLMPLRHKEPVNVSDDLRKFNVLPAFTRTFYDTIMRERMPALLEMVETSPLNKWESGSGKIGIVTYGVCDLFVREVKEALRLDFDILSLGFSNPLPMNLIRRFYDSIDGPVYVVEDGYRSLQEAMQQAGMTVIGKEPTSSITEWSPTLVAEMLGYKQTRKVFDIALLRRPPTLCAGCPYRLLAGEIALMKKKRQIEAVFGDIGCNTLLYFMNALDTCLAMGASEGKRTGFVLSQPEKAAKCLSIIGDSTESHSGMNATRNTVYRNVPGVKIVLDNEYVAMTGGQPSPTSSVNLAGEPMRFDLPASLQAHGANVTVLKAYDQKGIRKGLKKAFADAKAGVFSTLVVREGACLRQTPRSSQRVYVDPDECKQCNYCLVCPGLELNADNIPVVNHLCSGCGGHAPICVQHCPYGVLHAIDISELPQQAAPVTLEPAPAQIELPDLPTELFPERLAVAIRGVGGQGNLFFGRVLARLAFMAGYAADNIVKGDTHGMAQMGGPVISTFACGEVVSPVLLPGTADCLIAMEKSEVLRPGFLDMLREGGTALLAATKLLPVGVGPDVYPTDAQIGEALRDYRVIEVDVLREAMALGDENGRIANVVMLGVLSTQPPFHLFPPALWLKALQAANAQPDVWTANYAAFLAGREMLLLNQTTAD